MDVNHEQRRALRITIRLSAREHMRLCEACDRSGLTPSAHIRFILTREPPPAARRPALERRLLARILGDVGGIASTLRHIARALGGPHTTVFSLERDLAAALKRLGAAQTAIMAALGRKRDRR